MSPILNLLTAGLACAIPFVSAYTQPKGDSPSGNPISQPGLNSVVPAGEAFSVTWQPTTKGTVTLVLLKGPSTDAIPQYAIAEKIPNNGLFAWTPKTDLAPTADAEGYGIQLIDDATGAYQYTTQFGISNDNYVSSASSVAATSTPAPTSSGSPFGGHGGPHGGSWSDSWSTDAASWTTSAWTTSVWTSAKANTTAPIVTGGTAPWSTGVAVTTTRANVTMVAPTGGVTISKTSAVAVSSTTAATTSASGPAGPVASNAAGSVGTSFAGLVVAGAVAIFAL